MAVKKVNTEGVTQGNYGEYEYGSLSSYNPKYETQVNNNLNKLENYGPFKFSYADQKNDVVNSVLNPTPYAGKYQAQIDKYAGLMDSDYDPDSDASFLAYKNQYLRGGQKAMQDTMAKAVALSGGYDNSYANSVAQQTYNDYTAALADKIPELAKAAQDMYMSKLSMYQNLDNTEYARRQDERSDQYNQLNALMNLENTEYGYYGDDWNKLYNMTNLYQNLEDTNYGRFKDEYSMWGNAYDQQLALQQAAAAAAAASSRQRSPGSQQTQQENPSYFSTYTMDYYGGQSEGASYMSNENRQNYQALLESQGYSTNEAKKISKDYQRLYNRS